MYTLFSLIHTLPVKGDIRILITIFSFEIIQYLDFATNYPHDRFYSIMKYSPNTHITLSL